MLDWSVLQWLEAGQTPLLILMAYFLWKVERRVLAIEISAGIKTAVDHIIKTVIDKIQVTEHGKP